MGNSANWTERRRVAVAEDFHGLARRLHIRIDLSSGKMNQLLLRLISRAEVGGEGEVGVALSRRVSDLLPVRCSTRSAGWVFPSNGAASGHLCSIDRLIREDRGQAVLPKERCGC